jgi:hypothetical protein
MALEMKKGKNGLEKEVRENEQMKFKTMYKC